MKLDTFINRPVFATVISIFILILGVIGLTTLPVEQYPDIAPPTIRVSAVYPGANAVTVADAVLAPLEEAINGVEGMTHMTSTATNSGMGSITVYFNPDVDPDMAQVNVQNRVARVQGMLPAEVTRTGVSVIKRQSSTLLMFAVVDTEDRYDPIFLQNYVDINILPEIARVPGVGEASAPGAKNYTMRIWLKPEVMAQYGLMPTDIQAALAEQNIQAAPGELGERAGQAYQYSLTTRGRLRTPEEFENIILRANADGSMLRIKDVAEVELGALSYSVDGKTDGLNSMNVQVNQSAGSNATQVVNDILDHLEEVEETLPPGLEIRIGMNVNDFLYASIWNVIRTLIEAFILVMLVVYIFLQDWRSTLIPAIAIPVSLVGTFFFLELFGFSVNLLVLSALVLAIAIVVDDAIVVVEAVHAKLDQGYTSARKASIDAMSEISGAIISITLVMMAVFIPVSFMGGITGVFYKQFGLTMAVAIGLSGINALTLSPALCAVLLKPSADPETGKKPGFIKRFHIAFNTHYETLLGKYRKIIERIADKHWLTLGMVAAGALLLVFSLNRTPTGFVPEEDQGVIMTQISLQPGASLDETTKVVQEVAEIISEHPQTEMVNSFVGFGLVSGAGSSYGAVMMRLKPWGERTSKGEDVQGVIADLNQKFSHITNAQIALFSPPTIPGYSAMGGFSLDLQDRTGGDILDFYQVAQDFIADLNARPEISRAFTTFNPSFPMYEVNVDVEKAKMAGISPATIYATLQAYVGEMYVSNFNAFGRLYRVYIQSPPESRANLNNLHSIYVRNNQGQMAPITQFISTKKVYGPQQITRFNMFNSISVRGAPAPGYSSGEAIQVIRETAATSLPSGFNFEFSGLTREEQKTDSSSTGLIFLICIIFIYLLLAAQYESYLLPFAVILSVPLGLLGSFIAINIFGIDNNIYVQIALIMLIGLLAKNAILIVEYAKQRREAGMGMRWSAVAAAEARLRPIIMTSLALIIGLLPLCFSTGAGAVGNRALGIAAVGGMLIGVILQIFVVPGLFVIFQYLQEKVKPIEVTGVDESEIRTELRQYTDIE